MHLDARRVERDCLDADANNLRLLQFLEQSIEYASLGPTIHSGIDRVPIAKTLRQSAPLAAVFGHEQDGVDHLQVAQADIASLPGQTVFDLGELLGGDLHASIFAQW